MFLPNKSTGVKWENPPDIWSCKFQSCGWQNSSVGNASDLVSHAPLSSSPLPWWFKSQCMWEEPGQPCHIHAYTVYTSFGGKGRWHTRDESEESVVHRWGSTQVRESTLALKPRADITRSPKQGYQWPHKKDLCATKILKKKSSKVTRLTGFLPNIVRRTGVVVLWNGVYSLYRGSILS